MFVNERLETLERENGELRSLLAASVEECAALRRELAIYRERDADAAIVQHKQDQSKLSSIDWDNDEILTNALKEC